MKKFTFEKDIFKYNILGLKVEGKSICKTEPSTRVLSISLHIFFSNFVKNLNYLIDRMNE